jgi:hypothetical protein
VIIPCGAMRYRVMEDRMPTVNEQLSSERGSSSRATGAGESYII